MFYYFHRFVLILSKNEFEKKNQTENLKKETRKWMFRLNIKIFFVFSFHYFFCSFCCSRNVQRQTHTSFGRLRVRIDGVFRMWRGFVVVAIV